MAVPLSDSHATSSLDDVRIIDLSRHVDPNGSLTAIENDDELPFAIRRVFYMYDLPADAERGGHSHYKFQELIVAVSGSFDVKIDDGVQSRRWHLDRPYKALYLPMGVWRTLDRFSGGAVCLVMTSHNFDEADYVRDYHKFKALTANKRQ